VEHFVPSRSQQRAHNQHANLETHVLHLSYTDEHYALYRHYQEQRHHDGEMNRDDQEQYTQFLLQSRVNSRLVEFRDGPQDPEPGRLRMVSIIDIVEAGISSVYTFYDTTVAKASYGTYSILWQIAQVRQLKRPYLYLGYYIEESQKMAYKSKFKAIEGLTDNVWQPLHTR
jgi:arginine-tRNA-protein transferase